MTNERLITQPPQARMLAIPQEYITLCQETRTRKISRGENKGQEVEYQTTNLCAATFLYMLERWTHWKIRQAKGKADLANIWIYMSQRQAQEYELMNAFSRNEIKAGIELLMLLEYVSRRHNPEAGYDRTYQYRFETETVQKAVDTLSPMVNIKQWKVQDQTMEGLTLTDATVKVNDAIPQSPTESTQKDSTPAKAAGEGEPEPDAENHSKANNPWLEKVETLWAIPAARGGTILSVLAGTSKKHAICNIDPPVTEMNELDRFAAWYAAQYAGLDMPRSPEVLQDKFYAFRQQGNGHAVAIPEFD